MLVYVLHGAIVFFHATLSGFLLATGSLGLFAPDFDRGWLRRLGVISIEQPNTRTLGAVRLAFGLTLLAPLALGAPRAVSWFALIGTGVFLFLQSETFQQQTSP